MIRERGFALISALWTGLILALIAASVMTMGRDDARISRTRTIAAQGRAAADAGITLTIYRLMASDPAVRPPLDDTPFEVTFEGRMLTMRVQDESGRIDLNLAPATLIRSLLVSVGLESQAAEVETDRILDWRERGTLKRLNGAKQDDYRLAGFGYGPRNGPFLSIDELRLVMGMTPDLYERLRPAVTVVSQLSGIDRSVAPIEALLALSGMDAETATELVAGRRSGDGASRQQAVEFASLTGHAFSIIGALAENGRTTIRTAVVRLSGDLRAPLWIYAWQ